MLEPSPSRRLALILLVAVSASGCGWSSPGSGANGGGVGVAPPNPGGGQGGGVKPIPAPGGGMDPGGAGRPSIETPVPGQLHPAPVSVWAVEPSIVGRHVTVLLSWWSGPAPCAVLDSVDVVRAGTTITMTPLEGSDPADGGQVACPAIVMLRGTIVDLGELAPGTWVLAVSGDLAPIPITID